MAYLFHNILKILGLIRSVNGAPGAAQKLIVVPCSELVVNAPRYFAPDRAISSPNKITALELVDSTTLANVSDDTGTTYDSIGTAASADILLQVYDRNNALVTQFPLSQLNTRTNNGKRCLTSLNSQVWENCALFSLSASNYSSSNAVAIVVHYTEK